MMITLQMGSDEWKLTKKRKCNQAEDDEEKQPTNYLDSLPQELAVDIISRLPIKSLIQSRFVCKFWQNLSYDPHLVSLHLSKVLSSNFHYFIFHCDVPIKNQLYFVEFFNEKDDDGSTKLEKVRKFDTPFSSSMPEFNVIGSCNGILCLENSLFEEGLYLYNPFTQDYSELPKSTVYQDQFVMYGFGFHPVTNEHKLVRIAYYPTTFDVNIVAPSRRFALSRDMKSDVQIFTLGSNRWRSIGRAPFVFQKGSNPVLLNGRLHWTTCYGVHHGRPANRLIVSFDLADETFREVPGPELNHRISRLNYHLAVLGEYLCVAVPLHRVPGTLDLWIMREYNRKESWVKEITVGGYTPTLRTQEIQRSYGIWSRGKMVRVLCLLRDGEILLEYKGGSLVSYNPGTGMFLDITFPGLPLPSKTIIHVGTLNRVASPSQIQIIP
ncbi:OLC1v1026995C5 [Oldenlandia corymbosa var. corymbosa]|uniref:OLC1v1026995C5 n=1 Tax=Oldenlandia corymbosa var. corymbosa TaxID=529605 RepID=A0AAV1CAN1_OLDCO|nr:OLC1v1026995C5 [Oldenlandia corymbosa var. corymbosa]